MRRVVIDTNVYIDWFNAGLHEDIVFQRQAVKHLSVVVLMELRAGAVARKDQRLVQQVGEAFRKAGRLLVPSAPVFEEAGDVLGRLRSRGFQLGSNHSIVNDVLIALSAHAIGATVITQNGRHFRAIHAIRPFQLVVVAEPS